jgi:hypothetical protein
LCRKREAGRKRKLSKAFEKESFQKRLKSCQMFQKQKICEDRMDI